MRKGSEFAPLLYFSDIAGVRILLDMGVMAQRAIDEVNDAAFHVGKVVQAKFFASTVLQSPVARMETCIKKEREIVKVSGKAF